MRLQPGHQSALTHGWKWRWKGSCPSSRTACPPHPHCLLMPSVFTGAWRNSFWILPLLVPGQAFVALELMMVPWHCPPTPLPSSHFFSLHDEEVLFFPWWLCRVEAVWFTYSGKGNSYHLPAMGHYGLRGPRAARNNIGTISLAWSGEWGDWLLMSPQACLVFDFHDLYSGVTMENGCLSSCFEGHDTTLQTPSIPPGLWCSSRQSQHYTHYTHWGTYILFHVMCNQRWVH